MTRKPLILDYLEDAIVFPLWKHEGNRVFPAKWTTIDWSTYTWGEPYKDWSKSKQKHFTRPATNHYGILCNNYVIIDVDPIEDDNLLDHIKFLTNYLLKTFPGIDLDTLAARTKGGGFHFYYVNPGVKIKNDSGWYKNDNHGQIDIKATGGMVEGPSTLAWEPGIYALVNTTKPKQLPVSLIKELTKAPVIGLDNYKKKNAVYYLSMEFIPHGERDSALLQICDHYIKQNKSVDELILDVMPKLAQPEGEVISEEDIKYKYAYREEILEIKNTDRLSWALENFIYIKATDEVYYVPDKIVRTVEKLKLRHPEKIQSGTTSTGNAKFIFLVDAWLNSPDRLIVDNVGFYPEDVTIFEFNNRQYANVYIDRRQPAWHEAVSADDPDLVNYIKVVNNLMENDQRTIDLYFSSLGYKLKNMAKKQRWAWYFITPLKGIGKGILWEIQGRLFGHANKVTSKTLTSEFNTFKFRAIATLVDEADDIKRDRADNALKILVTATSDSVHGKHKDISDEQMPIYTTVEMHSNHVSKLVIESDERRYAPVHCRSIPLNNLVYEELGDIALPDIMTPDKQKNTNRFYSKLRRFLEDYPIHPDMSFTRRPDTKWLPEVSEASMPQMDAILLEAIQDGNTFTLASDVHTNQSFREMLEKVYGYKRITKNTLIDTLGRLERQGVIKLIKKKLSGGQRVNWDEYTGFTLSGRYNPDMYVIRNFEKYNGMAPKEIKAHFFPSAKQTIKRSDNK